MKFTVFTLLLLITCAAKAQPSYSPETRAEQENKWMKDSLHLSSTKLKRAYDISLNYYRQLDRFTNNDRMQEKVMLKKDANVKPMLTKEQYNIYYRRELEQRQLLRRKYDGRHKPL